MRGTRVGVVLTAAVFIYFVSIIQRSSMGVASLTAIDRYGVGAASISTLAVIQLAVYAAMQIPAGIAVERFGAKKLLVSGALFAGAGNFLVAFSSQIQLAVLGRMVVGFGDALIFISMIRLVNSLVMGSRATVLTQRMANVGQLGQIASAFPFAALLGFSGWTTAFSALACLGMLAAAVGALLINDNADKLAPNLQKKYTAWASLIQALSDPNTRKAFWVHFTLQASGNVFVLLWGFPFLVQGEGLSPRLATILLGSFVFIGLLVGPLLGWFCVRFPGKRHVLVTSVFLFIVGSWGLVILTPGQNPVWQISLLVVANGIGGPASMIAFDYSRTTIPAHRLSSSNGIINAGGFVATFICMFLVGSALDLIRKYEIVPSEDLYSLQSFKVAYIIQVVILTCGLAFFFRDRKLAQMALGNS